MTCDRSMDILLDDEGAPAASFIDGMRARIHALRCGRCRLELRRMEETTRRMGSEFLRESPDLSDAIMAAVHRDVAAAAAKAVEEFSEEIMPIRNWVLAGLCIFASLAISPLGAAFTWLVKTFGSGLILPIALTLGTVITAYCALFIASHLDELSERFDLSRGA